MPVFRFEAATPEGKVLKDTVDAASRFEAGRILRERHLVPLWLEDVGRGAPSSPSSLRRALAARMRSPLAPRDFASMTTRLATLLDAGLPLDAALTSMLQHGVGARPERILASIREQVRAGVSLAEAMERTQQQFSPMVLAMVRAGEASGMLATVLGEIGAATTRYDALRRRIRSALTYPAFLCCVGAGVVAFLLAFVVPRLTAIFTDFDHALPAPTQVLMALSTTVTVWWPWILATALVAALALRLWARTAAGRRTLHTAALRTPFFGTLWRRFDAGRYARTLYLLLKHGVPLHQALSITQGVLSNAALQRGSLSVRGDVIAGGTLAAALRRQKLFNAGDMQMIAAGEESGALAAMLRTVARACEADVQGALSRGMALLEPVLILVLGSIVGGIVLAIMLPLFEMGSLLSG